MANDRISTTINTTGSFIKDGWVAGDVMEVPTKRLPSNWPESATGLETTRYRVVEVTAKAMTIEPLR